MDNNSKLFLKINKTWLTDDAILIIGIVFLLVFLLLPEPNAPSMIKFKDDLIQTYCTSLPTTSSISCNLSQSFLMNLEVTEFASSALKGKGAPSDLAQDIVGFRALVAQQDPYPILGPAYHKIGLEWGLTHASTHPPMAFLLVAPIAFLPWNWASAIWAWFMLTLIVFTLRFYGISWKKALGLTPLTLLWPPISTSLSQFTIIWLFVLAAGYPLERKQQFWSGILVGLATLTKFFPGIMAISFLLKRKWLALLGFMVTLVAALFIVLLLYPGAINRYIEVNQTNSVNMILRNDNSSLLFNSYRFAGWMGLALVLFLFFLIIWANKECFYNPQLSTSPRLWILLSYFSVALLPISWNFSLAPLLPIVVFLIFRKKLSTLTIGLFCILIPYITPASGFSVPLALVTLLIGLGLLFDALPFKLFTATTIRDLIRPSHLEKQY